MSKILKRLKKQRIQNYEYQYKRNDGQHNVSSGLKGITSNNMYGEKGLVCAGFAALYREVCNYHNIQCEYVRGDTPAGRHAWNVLVIDGEEIPVDLTWSVGDRTIVWGKSEEYAKNHKADPDEKYSSYLPEQKNINDGDIIHDYENKLFGQKLDKIKSIMDLKYGVGEWKHYFTGYVTTGNINLITRTDGARDMMSEIPLDMIMKYVKGGE